MMEVIGSRAISYDVRFVGTGDPIEEEDKVEFRLLYEGELLPSAGSNKRAHEKHLIRKSFHPQLRRLWKINQNLARLAEKEYLSGISIDRIHDELPNEGDVRDRGVAAIGRRWARAGFNIVPLVTADMALRCSIHITLLRPEEARLIFRSGDIDGQLKTLFDALRMPNSTAETCNIRPEEDENPLFCLLEDDRLVSEVTVTTDVMLLLPNTREVKANDAHAIIHVKLNHKNARTFDNYFG